MEGIPEEALNDAGMRIMRQRMEATNIRQNALREILAHQEKMVLDAVKEVTAFPCCVKIDTLSGAHLSEGQDTQQLQHDVMHMAAIVQSLRNRGYVATFGQSPPMQGGHVWNVWVHEKKE